MSWQQVKVCGWTKWIEHEWEFELAEKIASSLKVYYEDSDQTVESLIGILDSNITNFIKNLLKKEKEVVTNENG